MLTNWFLFSKGDIFLREDLNGRFSIPCDENIPLGELSKTIVIADFHGKPSRAIELDSDIVCPNGYKRLSLRNSYYYLDTESYLIAGKAAELLNWNSATQFCGACGAPLQFQTSISKRCPSCGREWWPKLSPAIIVLIRRQDEILLVQSKSFKYDFYGLVAGFVETGESLEDCVHREVREETGLTITNLRYFNSQPWPYPRGLMIGFTADYLSGELYLQSSELKKGGWFRRDNLPTIPEKLSMARQLIDYWLGEQ